jgi:hypothetical protein
MRILQRVASRFYAIGMPPSASELPPSSSNRHGFGSHGQLPLISKHPQNQFRALDPRRKGKNFTPNLQKILKTSRHGCEDLTHLNFFVCKIKKTGTQ